MEYPRNNNNKKVEIQRKMATSKSKKYHEIANTTTETQKDDVAEVTGTEFFILNFFIIV
ncbi:hypothetical protein OAY05_00895 [Gammaproteobacteria bacterium]|nr:hypothetical protein [Gammaproteobacteria bacterium]